MHNRLRLLTIVILLAGTTGAFAQTKDLTLKEAVLGRRSTFAPERLSQLQWVRNADKLAYVDVQDSVEQLILLPVNGGSTAPILSKNDLQEWLGDKVQLSGFPRIHWLDEAHFQFQVGYDIYEVSIPSKSVEQVMTLPTGASHVTFDNGRTKCSYVKDGNLYVQHRDGNTIQLTKDGKGGIVYGQSVHRNEFGITHGQFWSPDGKRLAFYRMDESTVTDYPLVDISSKPASLRTIKYPMAGQSSHRVQVMVYDLESKSTKTMQTGTPSDQYLCGVTWAPESDAVYITVLNRDQNHLKLNRYVAKSGALDRTLFEESHKYYVEPERGPWFLPDDPNRFIWFSERDGFDHLYLYTSTGKLLRPLTTGNWEVERIIGMDDTRNFLFIEGTGEPTQEFDRYDDTFNALHRFTYVVDIELGGVTKLNERLGTHHSILSDDGKYLIEHFTSHEMPWQTTLYTAMGKELDVLHTAGNPLDSFKIGSADIGTITSGGSGERLFTRVIKPSDFDPSKKYPVLIYLYGGPHAQLITDSYLWGAPLWMYWMAEQGYLVATVDNRGSANRGLAFEQATFRRLGQEEMVDQKLFVDGLRDLPYVDKDRMAIHGWSYGGFMTINMMLTFPDLFQVGVAGGPVCDWSMYEVMYTERYMDTPEANPEGYAVTNLVERAKHLENDLLVIHGTVDDVVVWQHSQAFLKACVDNEIQLDYFVYPGHPHNVRGKDRYHLMEKVLHYIDERIGGK